MEKATGGAGCAGSLRASDVPVCGDRDCRKHYKLTSRASELRGSR